jgi:hypothetical protein
MKWKVNEKETFVNDSTIVKRQTANVKESLNLKLALLPAIPDFVGASYELAIGSSPKFSLVVVLTISPFQLLVNSSTC